MVRVSERMRLLRLGLCPKDRKSTRLNSSHLVISYAVFCLKKKKKIVLEEEEADITPASKPMALHTCAALHLPLHRRRIERMTVGRVAVNARECSACCFFLC